MTVYLAQCLCPQRHPIMEVFSEHEDPEKLKEELRGAVESAIDAGISPPWCMICGADRSAWSYEVAATAFDAVEEVLPTLAQREHPQIGCWVCNRGLLRKQAWARNN